MSSSSSHLINLAAKENNVESLYETIRQNQKILKEIEIKMSSSSLSSSSHLINLAAKENNVKSLYEAIRENPKILKEIEDTPFADTPLHVAAENDNTIFVAEMMNLMPSFSRKLNCDGLSPLHLAVQKGHLDTAREMVALDAALIRFPGRGKMTPMHDLVSICSDDDAKKLEAKLELLNEFLWMCPEAVKDVTTEGKTPLHIAVDAKHLKAFEVLYGWAKRTGQRECIRAKDNLGNNVLHLAVITNQPKVVKRLEQWGSLRSQINKKGLTPLDIGLKEHDDDDHEMQRTGNDNNEVKKILKRYSFMKSKFREEKVNVVKFLGTKESVMQVYVRLVMRMNRSLNMELRNVMLVVAVLVVTAAYQAALQPPGGVTQASFGDSINTTAKLILPKSEHHHLQHNYTIPKYPGKVIMGSVSSSWFMFVNTFAFISTVGVILFVLPVKFYSFFVHFALIFMTFSYLISIHVTSNQYWVSLALIWFSLVIFGSTCVVRFFIYFIGVLLEWKHMFAFWQGILQFLDRYLHVTSLYLQMETVLRSPKFNNPTN